VDKLALDLYDYLSKDNLEDAQELIDQFFQDNYNSVDDDVEFVTEKMEKEESSIEEVEEKPSEEEPKDVQVTFSKEVQQ
jgi:hypothetical protein